jgi:DUF4097 and DUF4098 domain-containing protein YvlB
MEKTFEVDGPVQLDVQLTSGEIEVDATGAGSAEVELLAHDEEGRQLVDAARVELRGRELVVDVPWRRRALGLGSLFHDSGITCRIRCPEGSSLKARTKSADVRVRGTLGGIDTATASGDVDAGDVRGDVVAKSASGDVRTASVAGKAAVNTASGDVALGRVSGTVAVNSASGDVSVEAVGGDAKANTASGDIRLGEVARGEVSVNSASGDVRVGIRRGARAHLDCSTVSGDTRSELDVSGDEPDGDGPLVGIKVRTVSGDIAVVRAPEPADVPEVHA